MLIGALDAPRRQVAEIDHTLLWSVLILLFTVGAWVRRRSVVLALFVPTALLFIMNLGYWAATIETLTLVLVAALVATVIGVPIGIAAARRPRLQAAR